MEFNYKNNPSQLLELCKEILRKVCLDSIRGLQGVSKKKYEVENILARHIIAEKTYEKQEQDDQIIPTFRNSQKMESEMINIGVKPYDISDVLEKYKNIAQKFVDKINTIESNLIFGKVVVFNNVTKYNEIEMQIEGSDIFPTGTTVKKIKVQIDKKAFKKLRQNHKGNEDDFLYYALRVITRYNSVGGFGLGWSLDPKSDLLIVPSNYSTLEIFASPINTVFSDKYFSLFYDIDRVFGSLGSFPNITDFVTENTLIDCNPPYIERILNDAAELMLTILRTKPHIKIIFACPKWDDLIAYRKLNQSQYLVKTAQPGVMEDILIGKSIVERMHNTIVFVLKN